MLDLQDDEVDDEAEVEGDDEVVDDELYFSFDDQIHLVELQQW